MTYIYSMFSELLSKIIALFTGGSGPEAEKKKLLREVKKSLKKWSKYYNAKNDDVTQGFAQFFYTIYKTVGPAQVLLNNLKDSGAIKHIVVDSFLTEKQLDAVHRMTPDSIKERIKSQDVREASAQIRKELVALVSSFDVNLTNTINQTYNLLLTFQDFISFDYYFLLKKFDSMLPANDFVYKPRFTDISGTYIVDDLKDFLDVLSTMDVTQNWSSVFSILKVYRQSDIIDEKSWYKVLKSLTEMNKNKVILNMIKVLDQNPLYKPNPVYPNDEVVDLYIQDIKNDAESTLNLILKERRHSSMEKLIKAIFGSEDIAGRTRYYTESANITFSKKNLEGYIYVNPINYLRAFYLDFFKVQVKSMIELLLIQGLWSTNVISQEFSESFYVMQQFFQKVMDFDNSLADDSPAGMRLKTLIRKADKDKIAHNSLKSQVSLINKDAKEIIDELLKHLIVAGNHIKSILEEFKAGKLEMILNWKELQATMEEPLEGELLEVYKKLYYLVQLIQTSLK